MNIMKQQGTTLVQRACANVNGFKALHKKLERKIIVSGKSPSTLSNTIQATSSNMLQQVEEYTESFSFQHCWAETSRVMSWMRAVGSNMVFKAFVL